MRQLKYNVKRTETNKLIVVQKIYFAIDSKNL